MWKRVAAVVSTAAALLLAGSVLITPSQPSTVDTPPAPTALDRLQQRLREVPGDWTAWAALGLSYVERARITADPAYYPKAEGALRESLRLHASDLATTGLGALANARHDFAQAAALAQEALAANPFSAQAYGVLADALTQLGQPAAATQAVQRMLDLDPGLPMTSSSMACQRTLCHSGSAPCLMPTAPTRFLSTNSSATSPGIRATSPPPARNTPRPDPCSDWRMSTS